MLETADKHACVFYVPMPENSASCLFLTTKMSNELACSSKVTGRTNESDNLALVGAHFVHAARKTMMSYWKVKTLSLSHTIAIVSRNCSQWPPFFAQLMYCCMWHKDCWGTDDQRGGEKRNPPLFVWNALFWAFPSQPCSGTTHRDKIAWDARHVEDTDTQGRTAGAVVLNTSNKRTLLYNHEPH